MKKSCSFIVLSICCCFIVHGFSSGMGVKRNERIPIVSTVDGEISAVRVDGRYLLHFFDLEPDSMLLPLVLHADMLFFVQEGFGELNWVSEEHGNKIAELRRGDIYRLQKGTVFYVKNHLGKLQIHALFPNSDNDLRGPETEPYSVFRDSVMGFGRRILEATFDVSEEVIDTLMGDTKPPAIVRFRDILHESKRSFLLRLDSNKVEEKKKRAKLFNVLEEEKDFENCNGWIGTVTGEKLTVLKGTNFALFTVEMGIGSMMGPRWNPAEDEISVVLQGRGMVSLLCSGMSAASENCRNTRFELEEGDVFLIPKFHTVAQTSFNNDTLVFMGFTSYGHRRRFLKGPVAVLRRLDADVLAKALDVSRETAEKLVEAKDDSPLVACVSCAEEEWENMQGEIPGEEEEEEEYGGRRRGRFDFRFA